MRHYAGWFAAALVVLMGPVLSAAQSGAPRYFLTVGALDQVTHNTFSQDLTFTVYSEDGHLQEAFKSGGGARVEVGGGIRFGDRFGVGVTASRVQSNGALNVVASVPNPFFFNQPRPATINTSGQRTVLDLHVQVLYVLIETTNWLISVNGGPTFGHVNQELATALTLTDVYPYDTVTIKDVTRTKLSGSRLGANIGADVTWMLNRNIGISGDIRWSGTSIVLKPDSGTVKVQTGGGQAGGGVRLMF